MGPHRPMLYKRRCNNKGEIDSIERMEIDPKLGLLIVDEYGFAVQVSITSEGYIMIANNDPVASPINVQPVSDAAVLVRKGRRYGE